MREKEVGERERACKGGLDYRVEDRGCKTGLNYKVGERVRVD